MMMMYFAVEGISPFPIILKLTDPNGLPLDRICLVSDNLDRLTDLYGLMYLASCSKSEIDISVLSKSTQDGLRFGRHKIKAQYICGPNGFATDMAIDSDTIRRCGHNAFDIDQSGLQNDFYALHHHNHDRFDVSKAKRPHRQLVVSTHQPKVYDQFEPFERIVIN
jgi:hypothetical protein